MSRRVFMNQAETDNFQFFPKQYFPNTNENDEDDEELSRINHKTIHSKEDTLYDADDDELEQNDRPLKFYSKDSSSSSSSDRLRIDPDYKWLLKDLNLSNETRVIDVTDILDDNQVKNNIDEDSGLNKESESVILYKPNPENLLSHVSMNNTSKDQDNDQEIETLEIKNKLNQLNSEYDNNVNNQSKLSDEYDEDHQNDHKFISKLYERLIKPIYANESIDKLEEFEVDSTESELDVGNKTADCSANNGVYDEWSKNHRKDADLTEYSEHEEEIVKNESPKEAKKKSKFSKSFEVSLDTIDNIIDRVDNGIKLRRGKFDKDKETEKTIDQKVETKNSKLETAEQDQSKIVESLKQEWSSMFNKLEYDYKLKLDEQQKLNDLKLKSLHDDIKKCMNVQEKFFVQIEKVIDEPSELRSCSNPNLKSTITINTVNNTELRPNCVDASTSTSCDPLSTNSIVDNAKYISNLRMELKTKHARHLQDLKDYYDKEIEDLNRKLDNLKLKYGETGTENDEDDLHISEGVNLENKFKSKYDQLLSDNSELKSSNEIIINKLSECNDHIKMLKHENFELANSLSQLESKLKHSEEKNQALLENYSNLESQLSDTLKSQDKLSRDLQNEKRNLAKKSQENDDLQMNIKYFEQKCDNYELKLDEKDNFITRLKSKLVQTETDLNRVDYEFQKLKKLYQAELNQVYKSAVSSSNHQQPYVASTTPSKEPIQVQIRSQNRYSSNPNFASISSQQSPNGTHTKSSNNQQQLTVLCNSLHNNQQLSSSSSSSKSPVLNRSRSPSFQKHKYDNSNLNDFNEDKYFNPKHQQQQYQSEDSIKYQTVQQKDHLQAQAQHMNNMNHLAQEDTPNPSSYMTYNNSNNLNNNNNTNNTRNYIQTRYSQSPLQNQNFKISSLSPDSQIKYIEQLEHEFDLLMKQRQQLDAKLTRLPYKGVNTNMQAIRETIEDELSLVEKKLASVKLEMRKLNIIKTH